MRLKDFRKMRGITLTQACKQLDVSYQALWLWENGLRFPTKKNLKKIYKWSGGAVRPYDFFDLQSFDYV